MLLLDKFLVFGFSIFVCFFFAKLLYKFKWVRRLFILALSLIFTGLTIFFFTKPSDDWSLSDQKSLITSDQTNKSDMKAYQFVWDNFIVVDNSFDKILVPNEDFDAEDSLSVAITDRKKLLSFLKLLNMSNQVDFVVCDINLEFLTPYDYELSMEMEKLNKANKLVLSYNKENTQTENNHFSSFPKGNIAEKASNQLFTTHYLVTDSFISLPFEIYKKMNSTASIRSYWGGCLISEKDKREKKHWIASPFFPEFEITNERLLCDGNMKAGPDSLQYTVSDFLSYFPLGQTVTANGKLAFTENLQKRKGLGKQNIIFLGSFKSVEDTHQTLYGNLHGPVIILNIIYSLQQHNHYLTISFVLSLLIAYFIIIWLLLYRALELPMFSRNEKKINWFTSELRRQNVKRNWLNYKGKSRFASVLINGISLIFYSIDATVKFLIVDELHFTLLFLFAWLIDVIFDRIINVMSLVSYFGVIYICLKYSLNNTQKNYS